MTGPGTGVGVPRLLRDDANGCRGKVQCPHHASDCSIGLGDQEKPVRFWSVDGGGGSAVPPSVRPTLHLSLSLSLRPSKRVQTKEEPARAPWRGVGELPSSPPLSPVQSTFLCVDHPSTLVPWVHTQLNDCLLLLLLLVPPRRARAGQRPRLSPKDWQHRNVPSRLKQTTDEAFSTSF